MPLQAKVEFLAGRSQRPVYYASSAGRNATHEIDQATNIVSVEVEDARLRSDNDLKDEFGSHPSGFNLHKFPSRVRSFLDQIELDSVYAAEIEKFLKATTGCYRVHIFDYTVRASDPELREIRQVREPAYLVHNDYTSSSGFACLRESLGDEADKLAQGRFQIINIWRPLVDPVEDFPLALCDIRSQIAADVVDTERRAPNHSGEIQLALHRDGQRWFYFSKMRPDEVLLLKTFDSFDNGVSPCSIHSAIRLPDAPADAKPRESIEARALVFFS